MGSDLSCFHDKGDNKEGAIKGPYGPGNVYDEAEEGDAPASTASSASRSETHNNNKSEQRRTSSDKVDAARVAAGSAPAVKSTFQIQHDAKGYTMVLPKNKSADSANSSPPQSASASEEVSYATVSKNPPLLPAAPNGEVQKNTYSPRPEKKLNGAKNKNNVGISYGSYCNVTLPSETNNAPQGQEEDTLATDDVYLNTCAPSPDVKLPVAPKPELKPKSSKAAGKATVPATDLNYVDVEIVEQPPAKGKHQKVKKQNSPTTQYTDVRGENGVLKIVG